MPLHTDADFIASTVRHMFVLDDWSVAPSLIRGGWIFFFLQKSVCCTDERDSREQRDWELVCSSDLIHLRQIIYQWDLIYEEEIRNEMFHTLRLKVRRLNRYVSICKFMSQKKSIIKKMPYFQSCIEQRYYCIDSLWWSAWPNLSEERLRITKRTTYRVVRALLLNILLR